MTTQREPSNQLFEINATAIGEFALEEIRRKQAGQVIGVTSAGVFIRTERGKIVFLSEMLRRGPLSINLGSRNPRLRQIRGGDEVRIEGGSVELPGAGLVVHAGELRGWHPSEPTLDRVTGRSSQRERLDRLASSVRAARPGRGFSWLLSGVTEDLAAGPPADVPLEVFEKITALMEGLREREPATTAPAAARLLGYGLGLTPAGDDLLIGVLLMLNRWPVFGWNFGMLNALNVDVSAASREATTALSVSLIECAIAGQADEFLVMTADYLITAQGTEKECLDGLLGWGSNSGIDTLAGMALVLMT